jgi:hypothetical protein
VRNLFVFAMTVLMIAACDSPRNHRVRSGDDSVGQGAAIADKAFPSSGLKVQYQWLSGPFSNVKQNSSLIVYLSRDGKSVSLPAGQELNFYATMPSMGHPIEQPGYFEELSTGIYLNKNIVFNMQGPWVLELWVQDSLTFNILDKIEWSINL